MATRSTVAAVVFGAAAYTEGGPMIMPLIYTGCRVLVGATLTITGFSKLLEFNWFVQTLASYKLAPRVDTFCWSGYGSGGGVYWGPPGCGASLALVRIWGRFASGVVWRGGFGESPQRLCR